MVSHSLCSILIFLALATVFASARSDRRHATQSANTRRAGTYQVKATYQSESFFTGWNWPAGADSTTHGNANYLSQTDAVNAGLVGVNSAGQAFMKVDNTSTVAAGGNRNSIRIESTEKVTSGDLVIIDAAHVPYGCSVWPAFWSYGTNWPTNGEIDIFEGVNGGTNNQMTLHTLSGCTHSSAGSQTGTVVSTDCSYLANGNQGCAVEDPSTQAYGADFAAAGGGVWAMEWTSDAISIWFWSRTDIPADVTAGTPDPTTWGVPKATWLATTCNLSQFFGPQTLTFDITLCGDWAGQASIFAQTCQGTCTDLVANGANYDNAYFLINYLRVFTS